MLIGLQSTSHTKQTWDEAISSEQIINENQSIESIDSDSGNLESKVTEELAEQESSNQYSSVALNENPEEVVSDKVTQKPEYSHQQISSEENQAISSQSGKGIESSKANTASNTQKNEMKTTVPIKEDQTSTTAPQPSKSTNSSIPKKPSFSLKPFILGYYTKYTATDMNSYQSLKQSSDIINSIATASLEMNSDGSISGYVPNEALSYSKQNGIVTFATIQNRFNADLTHKVLTSDALRYKLIQNMLKTVKDNGYTGLNIDFENMYASDRGLFNQFVTETVQVFHDNNLPVIVSVPAKMADNPSWAWSGTFDYNHIGKTADYMQIMTYDEHGQWGEPGSVSGLNWVERVISYARNAGVPSSKIIIGLPAYGYDWNITLNSGHKALTSKQIKNLISTYNPTIVFDAKTQSPHFDYVDANGNSHTVWYENHQSIVAKTALVNKYNLAGVSVWRMGQEDRSFWESVRSGL